MMNQLVEWRAMFFELVGDNYLYSIPLGRAEIAEIQAIVCPDDDQEMCGSYPLSKEMVEWLAIRFDKTEIIDPRYDLFLERET